jgi:hypothetical protein
LKDVYTHIMDYAWSQEFDFHQIFSKWQVVELSHFVHSGKLICPSNFRLGSITIKCICKTQMMPPPDHQNPVDIMCINIKKCKILTWFVRLSPPTVLELQL